MPVYRKRDINPDMRYVKLGKYVKMILRLSAKKVRIEKQKTIFIITDDIHEHTIDTENMFKKKE